MTRACRHLVHFRRYAGAGKDHLERSGEPYERGQPCSRDRRLQLRQALHRIKRAQGLKDADRVIIWNDGSVTDQQDNVLGNVYDEIS
jgi:hypothetical protein